MTAQIDGTNTIYFRYDSEGQIISFEKNGVDYYYIKNLQRDIIGIVDSLGDVIVEYVYDVWGNVLDITGSYADTIGQENPIRYRGYYWDFETELYYLQSRYYDSEVGRFINADEQMNEGIIAANLFAYCENNTVNCIDENGRDAIWLQNGKGAGALGHVGLLVQASNGYWYHVYWDGNLIITRVGSAYVESLYTFNRHLKFDDKYKMYQSPYTGWIYLSGDFSNGYLYLKNSLLGKYNLIWRNCMQVTIATLRKGTFKYYDREFKVFLTRISLGAPNFAYLRLFQFANHLKKYKNARVKWTMMSPMRAAKFY